MLAEAREQYGLGDGPPSVYMKQGSELVSCHERKKRRAYMCPTGGMQSTRDMSRKPHAESEG